MAATPPEPRARPATDVWEELRATALALKQSGTLIPSPVRGILNEIVGISATRISRRSESERSGVGGDATFSEVSRLWERLTAERIAWGVGGLRFAMALLATVDGVDVVNGELRITDWRAAMTWFAPRPRRYWALFANPRVYRIDDAVRDLSDTLWTTCHKDLRLGDRALFWRGSGDDGHRGALLFGEVLTEPSDTPVDSEYWTGQRRVEGPTVQIRFVRPTALPQLFTGPVPRPWSHLAISRARGGTIFEIKDADWDAVLDAAGGWPVEIPSEVEDAETAVALAAGRRRPRPPARTTAAERRAIERRAVDLALAHFRGLGFDVRDVGATESWDIECKKPGMELHVEVKGTKSLGAEVVLTNNEVLHARGPIRCALVVVSSISLTRQPGSSVAATGGVITVWDPWSIDEGNLVPVGYTYTIGPGGQVVQ